MPDLKIKEYTNQGPGLKALSRELALRSYADEPLRTIHQRGLPPKGMALHIEAVLEFRHTREANALISPVNAHHARQRFSGPGGDAAASCEIAPEYNLSSERLPQLLSDKRMPESVLKAASLGLPARRAGVVSW